jgi:hypothetical protein
MVNCGLKPCGKGWPIQHHRNPPKPLLPTSYRYHPAAKVSRCSSLCMKASRLIILSKKWLKAGVRKMFAGQRQFAAARTNILPVTARPLLRFYAGKPASTSACGQSGISLPSRSLFLQPTLSSFYVQHFDDAVRPDHALGNPGKKTIAVQVVKPVHIQLTGYQLMQENALGRSPLNMLMAIACRH